MGASTTPELVPFPVTETREFFFSDLKEEVQNVVLEWLGWTRPLDRDRFDKLSTIPLGRFNPEAFTKK